MKNFRKIPSLKFLYEINEDGIVRNIKSKQICKPFIENNGYIRISFHNKSLCDTKKIIHFCLDRLVAECWCKIPEHLLTYTLDQLQVNHKDGKKFNNNYTNLEWCLPYENTRHAFNTGLSKETEIWKEHKFPKKPIKCIEENLDFTSSYQAAEWLIKKFNYKKRYSTVAQGIRECAIGKNKTAYNYKWKYI